HSLDVISRGTSGGGARTMENYGRREFLTGTALWGAALVTGAVGAAPAVAAEEKPRKSAEFPMPGPFRGRVVEVAHPGSIVDGAVNAGAVKEMMRRGMRGLTGEAEWATEWRRFFQKGDVVGIKVNPVGNPLAIS